MESRKTYLKSMPVERKSSRISKCARDEQKIYEELIAARTVEVSKQMEFRIRPQHSGLWTRGAAAQPVSPNRIGIILFGIRRICRRVRDDRPLDYMDRSVKSVDVLRQLELPILAVIRDTESGEVTRQRRQICCCTDSPAYMRASLRVRHGAYGLTYIDDLIGNIIHLPGRIANLTDVLKNIF